jgi:hypothetical protein
MKNFEKEGKIHLDKHQQFQFKKIMNLPINNSSKETLMKMIKKPDINYQITDIVKVLKTDKNSVTIHGKIFSEQFTHMTENVVIKILKDNEKVQDDLEIYSQQNGKVKIDSLKLFQHETVVVLKMLKNVKTLEQMLDESINIQEIFIEVLGLIYCFNDYTYKFWRFNNGSSVKRIVYHENMWKVLNLDQSARQKYVRKDYLAMNLVQVIDIFKLYGMRVNEMEELFTEFIDERKKRSSFWREESYSIFNFVFQKYFTKGCNNLQEYVQYV